MRILALALILIFASFSSFAYSAKSADRDVFQAPIFSILQTPEGRVTRVCGDTEDLVPAARTLMFRYFETEMLNSEFYENFLWLHPEKERFVTCLICETGRPNNPYWEHNFILRCEEDYTDAIMYAAEPEEDDNAYL